MSFSNNKRVIPCTPHDFAIGKDYWNCYCDVIRRISRGRARTRIAQCGVGESCALAHTATWVTPAMMADLEVNKYKMFVSVH